MRDSLIEITGMVVDLILFSLIVGAIALFSSVSYSLLSEKTVLDSIRMENKAYRDLYFYDGKVLTGNDVILATQRFKRLYEFQIDIDPDPSGVTWLNLNEANEKNYGSYIWDVQWLVDTMGDCMDKKYLSEIIWVSDESKSQKDARSIKGLRFITQ